MDKSGDNLTDRHVENDCLRILSVFLVVILHVLGLGHSGILDNVEWMSNSLY